MPELKHLTLEAKPDSASAARLFLRETTKLDSMRHAEADLLVTELIGNVIQHSPSATHIDIALDEDRVHGLVVRVSHRHERPLDIKETGVGFLLLERLSRSWGHDHDGDTLTIWFSLRTPGSISISSDTTDEELFSRMTEDPAAFSDELVRRHTDLASSISRRYRGKGIDDDDLMQVANMALLKAIQRFDPSLGTLRPYAASTISGELKRLLRDRGWSVRVPRSLQERSLEVGRTAEQLAQILNRAPEPAELAAELDWSEDEVVEAMGARKAYASSSMDKPAESTGVSLLERLEDEDLGLSLADDRMLVEEAVSKLPERQQLILRLRFNDDMTQSEIAEEIGISQMHVSRLLAKSLEALKESIGSEPESG